ncbi:hypothetical protein GSS87_06170 [Corynebacterium sp. 4HC-13]|uniref:Uncharacterized protein n=1 Tax=Corynebacterium anserum TaxID=2684406 RepID=A0A7G7YPE5_9CORY|nr:hypothetical protein [Corynebacterium anserum]MBC2681983.1 hypothetical protein [Corynebacterium anserum]QNH96365.1 hypothetical protein GP473_06545 [Corynebacterium anserum]
MTVIAHPAGEKYLYHRQRLSTVIYTPYAMPVKGTMIHSATHIFCLRRHLGKDTHDYTQRPSY